MRSTVIKAYQVELEAVTRERRTHHDPISFWDDITDRAIWLYQQEEDELETPEAAFIIHINETTVFTDALGAHREIVIEDNRNHTITDTITLAYVLVYVRATETRL